jgi:hypothetical protein
MGSPLGGNPPPGSVPGMPPNGPGGTSPNQGMMMGPQGMNQPQPSLTGSFFVKIVF